MDIKITETLSKDNNYLKATEIKSLGCKKELYFEPSMLNYCSALYCTYCHRRFDTDEILKSIKNFI